MMRAIHHSTMLLAAIVFATSAFAAGDKDRKDKNLAAPTVFEVDKAHSSIGFEVRHLGIAKVNGAFKEFDVSITLEAGDPTSLTTEATIKTASVNTGVEKRDSHLRSDDFFNAEAYPEIRFVSTKVSDVSDDGTFKLHGDLTIRDVTKSIVLDAEMRGPISAFGKQKVAFSAETTVNRFDYGLAWNKALETGGLVASKNVKLLIEIEASGAAMDNDTE